MKESVLSHERISTGESARVLRTLTHTHTERMSRIYDIKEVEEKQKKV